MSLKQKKIEVEAVIFDLDGTLIDSIGIYFMIVEKTLERLNLPPVSRTGIRAAAGSDDFNWDLVLPEEQMSRKTEVIERAWRIVAEIAPPLFEKNVKLIAGADHILKRISSSGLKIGLATSTQRSYMKIKMQPLRHAGVDQLIDVVITSDDVEKRKPAPDPLIACAGKLDLPPENCAYVGDTATDIKAGKAAGMRTIGVLTGFDEHEMLEKESPDAVLDSVRNLETVIGASFSAAAGKYM